LDLFSPRLLAEDSSMHCSRALLSCAFFVALAFTFAGTAQPPRAKPEPKPGDKMIEAYLAAETDKLSKKELDGATILDQWKQRRPRLHREYMYMLGLDPLPEKTPLHPTITGTLEHQGVVIDKLHFQSKPSLYVTGNLYRPKGNTKKLPTILYVCGHANKGRDGNKSEYQDHGMWFASNGYNCLVLDSLQLGEIPGVHHGTYGVPFNHLKAYGIDGKNIPENRWWWQSRGYTPAGVECWNGIRAIDYLTSRPDVDAGRIGVTGISGGGAATFWIAAADERVHVAVPVSGMSDLESYVKNKVINGHCDCMFLYNTYQWEWTTIAALIAPRPLLFANSDHDTIFPMDGNRRIIERLRKLYKMYGKDSLVDDYVSEGGHAYRPDLRVAIFRFINKHLKNDTTTPVKDFDFQPISGKDLRVFPTDADIPKDAINSKIDETFVPMAKVKLPEKGKFAEWKTGLMKELRGKCFRAFPERIPKARDLVNGIVNLISTEPGIKTYSAGGQATEEQIKSKFGILYLADERDEKWLKENSKLVDSMFEKGFPCQLWTRGKPIDPQPLESLSWTTKSPPNYVERSHVLLGRTLDEGRVRDIIAGLLSLHEIHEGRRKSWTVIGRGQNGILAAYAALLEPKIKEVIIIDPPTSHRDGPTFLNVLRVLDIPEALGLLAPRRLTLINARDPAFDRTEQIYRLAGAPDELVRK
jgi:cephalosporin-C deacetylase-like acetyl esterase